MLTLNVIAPASVFDTATLVMSGALASSPVESGKVAELAAVRAAWPSAAAGSATIAEASANRRRDFVFT
jgi:hypothetical protein